MQAIKKKTLPPSSSTYLSIKFIRNLFLESASSLTAALLAAGTKVVGRLYSKEMQEAFMVIPFSCSSTLESKYRTFPASLLEMIPEVDIKKSERVWKKERENSKIQIRFFFFFFFSLSFFLIFSK